VGVDVQPVESTGREPVSVGIFSDDPLKIAEVVPVVEGLGWKLLTFDPFAPIDVYNDRISLLIFSLKEVAPSGLELITGVKSQSRANLLVISNDRNPQTIADALRSGADDYLVSPFEPAELVVRVRALVTRVWPSADRREGNDIKFDVEKRAIVAGPYAVQFTPLEWDVLSILLERDGVPVSTDAVASEISGGRVQSATVPRIISRVRRKLETGNFAAISVTTVQNRGYVAQYRRASDHERSRTVLPVPRPTGEKSQSGRSADDGAFASWENAV
jgi:DNA-binding response OmpR family regulator